MVASRESEAVDHGGPLPGLTELVPGRIWLDDYPVRYAGIRCSARMTVVRLNSENLLLHSPGRLDDELCATFAELAQQHFKV